MKLLNPEQYKCTKRKRVSAQLQSAAEIECPLYNSKLTHRFYSLSLSVLLFYRGWKLKAKSVQAIIQRRKGKDISLVCWANVLFFYTRKKRSSVYCSIAEPNKEKKKKSSHFGELWRIYISNLQLGLNAFSFSFILSPISISVLLHRILGSSISTRQIIWSLSFIL